MSNDELRAKLKHIAGLCLSLAVDASRDEEETRALRERVRELEAHEERIPVEPVKRSRAGKKHEWTDEQREAQRQRIQAMHARRKAEKAAKEQDHGQI